MATTRERVMQKLFRGIRTVMETLLAGRAGAADPGSNSALDWLPPVLGPDDWSMGLLADRSASWYFDRH
jgi:hypothetical protein